MNTTEIIIKKATENVNKNGLLIINKPDKPSELVKH